MADQRPLHDPGRRDRGAEHHEHAPSPDPQEQRVVQAQSGDQRADADDGCARSDRERRVAERGLHCWLLLLVSTFGGS